MVLFKIINKQVKILSSSMLSYLNPMPLYINSAPVLEASKYIENKILHISKLVSNFYY